MSDQIEEWLKRLDKILEHQKFETAEEAEAWLQEQTKNRSVDEFLSACAPPAARLAQCWQQAEQSSNPTAARHHYKSALAIGREHFIAEIEAARGDPALWQQEPACHILNSLLGMAAACEMESRFEQAEELYREVLELDPADAWDVHEKIFSLCLMDGRLRDARQVFDRHNHGTSSASAYHAALLRFLEAADEAEERYQTTGDVEQAATWQDPQAQELLEIALRKNPFVAALMAHPRAFDLSCPQQAESGTPAEAVMIMYASAHLWLSDFLALSWLLGGAKAVDYSSHPFAADWQKILVELGGEPSDEERFAYLRSLEEMDL